jgi:hypothetical protein
MKKKELEDTLEFTREANGKLTSELFTIKEKLSELYAENFNLKCRVIELEHKNSVMRDNLFQLSKDYFTPKDAIVAKVIEAYKTRSEVGIAKYGTTLEDNNTDNFLKHLQEELMDATLYIEKLKEIASQLK